MGHVQVLANVYNVSAEEVYAALCDFNRYSEHSDAVRDVNIASENSSNEVALSSWEVNFRQGILRWTEKDTFLPDKLTINFEQVEGDAESFSGSWVVMPAEWGCQVRFTAVFDMGIPSLSDIIEPIAEQALSHNIHSILTGLLSESIEFVQAGEKENGRYTEP